MENSNNSVGSFNGFSPNSSLQGELEKSWQIRKGKRILIKGNPDIYSIDSINEVFASLLHKKQGYDNYTDYKLIKIKSKEYEYACYSECFTSQKCELITAWDILNSDKKRNNESYYNFFMRLCEGLGMNIEKLRLDLDYLIMTDYVLSNRDRHMNNIALLRDADSLELVRMAPIYDTGKSMFVRKEIDHGIIDNLDINSFTNKEIKQLMLVKNKSLVDVGKLPTSEDLYRLYSKDSKISKDRINEVCEGYEIKLKAFKYWQNN